MKGSIRIAAALLGLAFSGATAQAQYNSCPSGCPTGTCSATGCTTGGKGCKTGSHRCGELYDRCWFERNTNLAHRAVNRALTPQVQNGHVLDQTVWNFMFEAGTDRLTPMGQAHLQYLSRRRPEPDRTIYLATAMDLRYDPACPERFAGARQELDSLRVAAVQKYLIGLNAGRVQDFDILLHDPTDVSISTNGASISIQLMYAGYRGGLPTGAGGAGGAAGPSGSVGGFAGSGGGGR